MDRVAAGRRTEVEYQLERVKMGSTGLGIPFDAVLDQAFRHVWPYDLHAPIPAKRIYRAIRAARENIGQTASAGGGLRKWILRDPMSISVALVELPGIATVNEYVMVASGRDPLAAVLNLRELLRAAGGTPDEVLRSTSAVSGPRPYWILGIAAIPGSRLPEQPDPAA